MIKKQMLAKLRKTAITVNTSVPSVAKNIPKAAFHIALQKLKLKGPKVHARGSKEDYYAQISEIVSFSEEGK